MYSKEEMSYDIDSAIFMVGDAKKPVKPGYTRVWFQDGIGTSTGWRDIPNPRIPEARAYYYQEDAGNGMALVSEFCFDSDESDK